MLVTLAFIMALQGFLNPQLTASVATAPTLGKANGFVEPAQSRRYPAKSRMVDSCGA